MVATLVTTYKGTKLHEVRKRNKRKKKRKRKSKDVRVYM